MVFTKGPVDYYVLLEIVSNDVTTVKLTTIKKAFRKLALKYHPDKGDHIGDVIFKTLNAAYEQLSDETLKAEYDVWYEKYYVHPTVSEEEVAYEQARKGELQKSETERIKAEKAKAQEMENDKVRKAELERLRKQKEKEANERERRAEERRKREEEVFRRRREEAQRKMEEKLKREREEAERQKREEERAREQAEEQERRKREDKEAEMKEQKAKERKRREEEVFERRREEERIKIAERLRKMEEENAKKGRPRTPEERRADLREMIKEFENLLSSDDGKSNRSNSTSNAQEHESFTERRTQYEEAHFTKQRYFSEIKTLRKESREKLKEKEAFKRMAYGKKKVSDSTRYKAEIALEKALKSYKNSMSKAHFFENEYEEYMKQSEEADMDSKSYKEMYDILHGRFKDSYGTGSMPHSGRNSSSSKYNHWIDSPWTEYLSEMISRGETNDDLLKEAQNFILEEFSQKRHIPDPMVRFCILALRAQSGPLPTFNAWHKGVRIVLSELD